MTKLYRYPQKAVDAARVIATLGNFDGVHRGHQFLLSRLMELKQADRPNTACMLITFYPHPAKVLGKTHSLPRLSGLHFELSMLKRFSVDALYLVHFTRKFSQMSARDFVQEVIIGRLNVSLLVVGPDARVGKGGEGTAQTIQRIMQENGRSCEILPFCEVSGERISSRKIRDAISAGRVELACSMLGGPYSLRGRVVRGAGRGGKIGFATANLNVLESYKLVPKNGVYACSAVVDGHVYRAVTNIGTRPTFESANKTQVETHLLDFPANEIYGQLVIVHFLARLRDEMKFSGAEALIAQIGRDIDAARKIALPA